MAGVVDEGSKRVAGFIHEGYSGEQISGVLGGQGTPRAGLYRGKPRRTFRQIENLCHAAFLSRHLLFLLNEGGVLFHIGAPLWPQDGDVLAARTGMSLFYQEGKIFSEPVPQRPNGRFMHRIHRQAVRLSERPHFFPTPAVQTEPPSTESARKPHAEEQ